jgi:hypothetical protein
MRIQLAVEPAGQREFRMEGEEVVQYLDQWINVQST